MSEKEMVKSLNRLLRIVDKLDNVNGAGITEEDGEEILTVYTVSDASDDDKKTIPETFEGYKVTIITIGKIVPQSL